MKLRGKIRDLSKGKIQKEIARALALEKKEKLRGSKVITYISNRYIKKLKKYKLSIPSTFRAFPPRKVSRPHRFTK